MRHHLVYSIEDLTNEMMYIGVHSTLNVDDGYMGSGINIRSAIQEKGIHNFCKHILADCEDAKTAYAIEHFLVVKHFVADKKLYNICEGGTGGWKLNIPRWNDPAKRAIALQMIRRATKASWESEQFRERKRMTMKALSSAMWKDSSFREKQALGASKSLSSLWKNEQFKINGMERCRKLGTRAKGKIWINNGIETKMIHPDQLKQFELDGWKKGRRIAPRN